MRREELAIPAVTALTSVDATAIRAIVSALTKEIYDLRVEVDALKERNNRRSLGMDYRNNMIARRG
jgi:proteasome assembly chaperone (PAC2) family protein